MGFNDDYDFSQKMKPKFIPHIENYFSQFGKIIELKDTEGQRYFDQNVGADILIKLKNKRGIIKDVRIDMKCRRPKYLSYFRGDLLFETKDNERSGWLDKTGTWIVYGFSNMEETGLAFVPIFLKITDDLVNRIKNGIRTKSLIEKTSYDGTKFVLIDYRTIKEFQDKNSEDLLMGEKQVNLHEF